MFVDLMHDIYTTFTERFLRAQIIYNPPEEPPAGGANGAGPRGGPPRQPTRRFNALGVLEDVPPAPEGGPVLDSGPAEGPPSGKVVTKPEPVVVGAGRAHALSSTGAAAATAADWSSVGRNDPCPCGSGKKFKKCHGATG
jgi:preprotein translocase subunit SecA